MNTRPRNAKSVRAPISGSNKAVLLAFSTPEGHRLRGLLPSSSESYDALVIASEEAARVRGGTAAGNGRKKAARVAPRAHKSIPGGE